MKSGNKRAAMRITTHDIAAAASVCYRTVLRDEKAGRWIYGDLLSITEYIKERRDGKNRIPGRVTIPVSYGIRRDD